MDNTRFRTSIPEFREEHQPLVPGFLVESPEKIAERQRANVRQRLEAGIEARLDKKN